MSVVRLVALRESELSIDEVRAAVADPAAEALDECVDGLVGVVLVCADDARRSTLGPAADVEAVGDATAGTETVTVTKATRAATMGSWMVIPVLEAFSAGSENFGHGTRKKLARMAARNRCRYPMAPTVQVEVGFSFRFQAAAISFMKVIRTSKSG